MSNKNIVLVMGKPSTGKSTSLRNIENKQNAVYFNTDLKELPFADANDFMTLNIADAADILQGVHEVEQMEDCHFAALDTLTFLMNMYESQYVVNAANTQAAWGDYAQFYRNLIHAIKAGSKDYAIFAHEADKLNEKEMSMETVVPVKGSVGKVGVEADFSIIVSTKRVSLAELEGFENDLLNITEEEQEDGFKYVFQTRIDKNTMNEKMRSPMGLWSRKEKFIDNDLDLVFKRIKEYYGNK